MVSRSIESHILLEMPLEYFVFPSFGNNVLHAIWGTFVNNNGP